ncbi:MAG: BTAD domain-containing putative transcriptional regulator [Trueperaceae bacterium]|nr:BTAD domain-containing putative transcriptional regulator [Trueperaceae bacterium]
MLLRTLGSVRIDEIDFTRPKPLLLLTYLALEGSRPRRHLAELFWPDAADPMRSLSVALTRLRQGAPGSVAADRRHAATEVRCDVHAFLAHIDRGERRAARDLYRGPFLDGLHLPSWTTELEEWLHAQREHLADVALRAHLDEAESQATRGRFGASADLAERASRLRWAVPQPDDLVRLHTLLAADGRARADVVRREGKISDSSWRPIPRPRGDGWRARGGGRARHRQRPAASRHRLRRA